MRVSVGGEEAVPLPPAGPAGAGALGWAAGVESSAAAAAGPKPHAARPAAGGVRPPSPVPRLGAPTRPRSGAGTGRGQREGPARGGEGAGPPRAGSGRGSPGGGGGGSGGGGRAARCPPQSARPRRTRARPRRGALSTARGEYRPRRPPPGRPPGSAALRPPPGDPPGSSALRRARTDADPSPGASLAHPPGPGLRSCRGALGAHGAPRARRARGRRGRRGWRADPVPGKPGSGPQFPFALGEAATQVCTPARGTSAWRAGGVDAVGCVWPLSRAWVVGDPGWSLHPRPRFTGAGSATHARGRWLWSPRDGAGTAARRLLAAFLFQSPAAPGLRGVGSRGFVPERESRRLLKPELETCKTLPPKTG